MIKKKEFLNIYKYNFFQGKKKRIRFLLIKFNLISSVFLLIGKICFIINN
jgi:hypothetical protein